METRSTIPNGERIKATDTPTEDEMTLLIVLTFGHPIAQILIPAMGLRMVYDEALAFASKKDQLRVESDVPPVPEAAPLAEAPAEVESVSDGPAPEDPARQFYAGMGVTEALLSGASPQVEASVEVEPSSDGPAPSNTAEAVEVAANEAVAVACGEPEDEDESVAPDPESYFFGEDATGFSAAAKGSAKHLQYEAESLEKLWDTDPDVSKSFEAACTGTPYGSLPEPERWVGAEGAFPRLEMQVVARQNEIRKQDVCHVLREHSLHGVSSQPALIANLSRLVRIIERTSPVETHVFDAGPILVRLRGPKHLLDLLVQATDSPLLAGAGPDGTESGTCLGVKTTSETGETGAAVNVGSLREIRIRNGGRLDQTGPV